MKVQKFIQISTTSFFSIIYFTCALNFFHIAQVLNDDFINSSDVNAFFLYIFSLIFAILGFVTFYDLKKLNANKYLYIFILIFVRIVFIFWNFTWII